MTTVTVNNLKLVLYNSIKEMPIKRHKLMQQYLLQESGIGSTIADVDDRMSKTIAHLHNNNIDQAKEELANLRYNFFSILSGLDFKCRSFACLIHSINDTELTDTSAESLSAVVTQLEDADMTLNDVEAIWLSVKKNLIQNSQPISLDGLGMISHT